MTKKDFDALDESQVIIGTKVEDRVESKPLRIKEYITSTEGY